MDVRQNVWEPWYLMTLVPDNVECKFYNNVISYHKDRMLFHLGYQHDDNERIFVIMCLGAQAQVEALFTICGKIIPR